jgi:hypothetical protein
MHICGAVLFADISGFTSLTEVLANVGNVRDIILNQEITLFWFLHV